MKMTYQPKKGREKKSTDSEKNEDKNGRNVLREEDKRKKVLSA